MKDLIDTTFLFSSNSVFIEELYSKYLQDKDSVDKSWQKFFENFHENKDQALRFSIGASWATKKTKIVGVQEPQAPDSQKNAKTSQIKEKIDSDQAQTLKALMLINAYRSRGHFLADLDPLGMKKIEDSIQSELSHIEFGFSDDDLEKEIKVGTDKLFGVESVKLSVLISHLKRIYCDKLGVEFMHIDSKSERNWIQNQFESKIFDSSLSSHSKKNILKDLIEVENFENFLHVKFPGTKRFSVEGGAVSIAALEMIINEAVKSEIEAIVIGMAHRGRINVLTKVVGKPYDALLYEFQGNRGFPDGYNISGDVKYHMGFSSERILENGKKISISLAYNPSHLEAVNPVVIGKVRAKQDKKNDITRSKVLSVLIHGDAAMSGQGIVSESLNFAGLDGYKIGGTIHIIINNQIGFTTNSKDSRFTNYCSDIAKSVNAPIFHVNGDHPEDVIKAVMIAFEYKKKFKKDAVIDIYCYRLYGHNEGDEPLFTQPIMYKNIANHRRISDIYAEKLLKENIITDNEYKNMVAEFRLKLDNYLESAKTFKPSKVDSLGGDWSNFKQKIVDDEEIIKTGISNEKISNISKALVSYPEGFNVNSKILRQIEAKKKMFDQKEGLDWATGEALAFGSLLQEGYNVRISGQDVSRGTFSHRHAVLVDQLNENRYIPLNNIFDKRAHFESVESNLSEYGVLGFEYGYSQSSPNSLVIWEGQFGDFANGAQIIIDQFISSGEDKWLRYSGLVMLLPHGYEGQGSEHSSARLERFLQLCARNNMIVANCTTPASYFHILRRQMLRDYRKPLVLMSPKSLLRHRLAVSNISDFNSDTYFKTVIAEHEHLVPDEKVKKLLICSGKIYYEILEARTSAKINDIAIIRMEQLYPFPLEAISEQLRKYNKAEVVWVQEEPENMGAWLYVNNRLENLLQKLDVKSKRLIYVGREESASPASGYQKIHIKEQEQLIKKVFS